MGCGVVGSVVVGVWWRACVVGGLKARNAKSMNLKAEAPLDRGVENQGGSIFTGPVPRLTPDQHLRLRSTVFWRLRGSDPPGQYREGSCPLPPKGRWILAASEKRTQHSHAQHAVLAQLSRARGAILPVLGSVPLRFSGRCPSMALYTRVGLGEMQTVSLSPKGMRSTCRHFTALDAEGGSAVSAPLAERDVRRTKRRGNACVS